MKRREFVIALISAAAGIFLLFRLPKKKIELKGRVIDGAVISPASFEERTTLREAVKKAGARGDFVLVQNQGEERYYTINEILDSNEEIEFERAHVVAAIGGMFTANRDFYKISLGHAPEIKMHDYKLEIKGLVEKEIALGYSEILKLRSRELEVLQECISNRPNGDLMSTAKFEGVPLKEVLALAGLKKEAKKIVFYSADGYSTGIPVEVAMREDVILVHKMNNEVLPRDHGYPVKLLIPGKYGMKCPKWIEKIEIVDQDYQGYWEKRGWSDTADVRPSTIIMQPAKNACVAKLPLKVKGFASSGAGIKRVLVSLDGASWEEAEMRHTVESKNIAAWEYMLNKMPDKILSVAEDLSGNRQETPYEIKVRSA